MNEPRVKVTLHNSVEDRLLFAGRPEDCPPLPRPGDQIRNDERLVHVEGVEYTFHENGIVHIALLG